MANDVVCDEFEMDTWQTIYDNGNPDSHVRKYRYWCSESKVITVVSVGKWKRMGKTGNHVPNADPCYQVKVSVHRQNWMLATVVLTACPFESFEDANIYAQRWIEEYPVGLVEEMNPYEGTETPNWVFHDPRDDDSIPAIGESSNETTEGDA